MKTKFLAVACICASLALTGCGFGSTGGNLAGNMLSGLAGGNGGNTGLLGGSTAGTGLTGALGGGMLGNLLSSVLGGATTSQASLVGTWTYNEPQVRFESENILANIGGAAAGAKLQGTLGNYLSKIGLQKGVTTYTFKSDGTYTCVIGKRTLSGTYTLSGNTLTLKGQAGLLSGSCICSVVGNNLYMLYDADKLMGAMTKLTSNVSQLGTLSSLLGNYNGMKVGMGFTR